MSEDSRYPLTRAAASETDTLMMAAAAAYDGYTSRYLNRLSPDVAAGADNAASQLLSAEAGGEEPPAETDNAAADDADALAEATAMIAVAILLRRGLLRMATTVIVPGTESGAAASDAASAASASFWRKRGVEMLRGFVSEKGGDPLKVKTSGYVDELF